MACATDPAAMHDTLAPLYGLDESAALRAIVEGTATHTGDRFFQALVESLARALGTHGAWVTEYRPESRRLRRAVEELGAQGVVHGNTRRAPQHRVAEKVREQFIELRRKKYAGFNDEHFTEKLCEVDGLIISRASVQRLLRAAGIGAPRRRRTPKHRRRRDRKPQAGLMILWDGSRHQCLEERGPMLCLMGAIDDATGELLPRAHFVEQECAAGYLRVLKAIAEEKGLPWSAYMDRHGRLKRNDEHWTLEGNCVGCRIPPRLAGRSRPWRSR